MFEKHKIAVLDQNEANIYRIKDSVEEKLSRAKVFGYPHPDKKENFMSDVNKHNIILIAHNLGHINGASIIKQLIMQTYVKADIFIYAENYIQEYNGFKFYLDIDSILSKPHILLNSEGTSVDRAVESVCLSKIDPNRKVALA